MNEPVFDAPEDLLDEAMPELMSEPVSEGKTAPVSGSATSSASSVKALSISDAKALLHQKHGVTVDESDPVMLLVTLHEAFLQDQDAAFERHNKAMTLIMSESVTDLHKKIHEETAAFGSSVQTLAENNTLEILEKHRKVMRAHQQFLFCATTALVAVPAVLFGLLCGVLLWKL